MRPVLIRIFGLPIHSYGLMLAIGFLLAIFLAIREGRKRGLDPEFISNLSFWILITSILGSRLFHSIVFWRDFVHKPWRILFLWEGGLVFYGGFIAAVAVSIFYCKKKGVRFFEVADVMAPGIALGLVFGRIGCTLVGCCYGKACPADYPFAITFPEQTIGKCCVPLYPTQVFESLGCLAIFLFLWLVALRFRTFSGQVLCGLLVLYSFLRGTLEFWRDDPRGFWTAAHFASAPGLTAEKTTGIMSALLRLGTVVESTTPGKYGFRLSESQVISILMLFVALGIWLAMRKTAPVPVEPRRKTEISVKKDSRRKRRR